MKSVFVLRIISVAVGRRGIRKRAPKSLNSDARYIFFFQAMRLLAIAFQFFCLELADEVEVLLHFRFRIVYIDVGRLVE